MESTARRNWLRTDSQLVRVEEPSVPFDLSKLVFASSLGSHCEREHSPIEVGFSAPTIASTSASSSTDNMGDGSIQALEIEKMVGRIVIASLEKLLRSDKGKDHVVIEDDENKEEFEKKEQVDDTWQDEEFFTRNVTTKKAKKI
ncbi:hypothetical protein JCGZ_09957 [Jatropha curcas]|uniref:Uncharacterized protein n=1 Tax=Jatropha curcas TaxID=180498 RepID=A0A067KJH1_JATCU|nr:hypothetical protein JCGZ_09957 [Jatropha curcas]